MAGQLRHGNSVARTAAEGVRPSFSSGKAVATRKNFVKMDGPGTLRDPEFMIAPERGPNRRLSSFTTTYEHR